MRLIDADAFKKILLEHEMKHDKRRGFDEYSYGSASAYEYAGDLLDEQPTVELPHGEWIPCSERLPEEDGKYLVCWCGAWGVDICFAEYSKCEKYWHEKYGGEYRGITAWMPLPKPYEEGR